MRRLTVVFVALLLAGAAGWAAIQSFRDANVGAVGRGYRVADRSGCFTCHGSGGYRGMPNPGYGYQDIPPWSGGIVTMYVDKESEFREWILDGMPKRIRDDADELKARDKATILMPAFRGRFTEPQLRDLIAYVKAVADFDKPREKEDAPAEAGRQVALKYGCFNCHGPQGRGSVANPGSFKGYVPGWDGADFPELVKSDAEFHEWVGEGRSKRFRDDKFASFFLDRAPVQMPAYGATATDAEISQLYDYVRWLRAHAY
jgi:mono/diheme cytochrome c family protein